jgi:hypothetical protein
MNSYKDDEKPWKKPGTRKRKFQFEIILFFRGGY